MTALNSAVASDAARGAYTWRELELPSNRRGNPSANHAMTIPSRHVIEQGDSGVSRQVESAAGSYRTFGLALVAAVASAMMGYNLSVGNTVIGTMTADLGWCGAANLSEEQSKKFVAFIINCEQANYRLSTTNGGFILGAAAGSMMSGSLMGSMGRRKTLMAVFVASIVTCVFGAVVRNFPQLLIQRSLAGVLSGISTIVPAVYLVEMVPPHIRGQLSLVPSIAVNIGIALGIACGWPIVPLVDSEPILIESWVANQYWWRIMQLLPLPFCAAGFFSLWKIYTVEALPQYQAVGKAETPDVSTYVEGFSQTGDEVSPYGNHASGLPGYYYTTSTIETMPTKPGDHSSLEMRGNGNLVTANESSAAVRRVLSRADRKSVLYLLWTNSTARRTMFLGWVLAIFQQLTGINAFVANSNNLFMQAGLSSSRVFFASLLMALLSVVCAVLSTSVITRISRRHLLIGGALGMSLSLLPAIVFSHPIVTSSAPLSERTLTGLSVALPVFATLSFVSIYSLTYGPGLFLYLDELFTADIQEAGISVAYALNWLTCFFILVATPLMTQTDCFKTFFVTCSLATVFAYMYIYDVQPTTGAPGGFELKTVMTPENDNQLGCAT